MKKQICIQIVTEGSKEFLCECFDVPIPREGETVRLSKRYRVTQVIHDPRISTVFVLVEPQI